MKGFPLRLATLAAVARRRADSLDRDAFRWHRIAMMARDALKRQQAARRKAEGRAAVVVPDEIVPDDSVTADDDTL